MTKIEAIKKLQDGGRGFLANVIINWHSNPAKKLKGAVKAMEAGLEPRIGNRIDALIVDGKLTDWDYLETL